MPEHKRKEASQKKSLRYTYFFIFPCNEESLSFIPCFPQVILATVNSSQCPVLQALCHTAPHRGHLKISGTHLFSALKQIIIPRRRTPRLNKLLSLGDQLPEHNHNQCRFLSYAILRSLQLLCKGLSDNAHFGVCFSITGRDSS